ncbi:hypothetical protein ElyMa_004189400 [Elysia marginata]|uniref:Uncharacterized protein n=1 Tax=Elysia marginata TaxID=1093978 RepID=A0AAV4GLT5_9GAST|nr:hypothetical protein ElyMa_004189400 [Elysia marginata]
MSSDDMNSALDRITATLGELSTRLSAIESRSSATQETDGLAATASAEPVIDRPLEPPISEDTTQRAQLDGPFITSPPTSGSADVERDFGRVRDSVTRIHVPNNYKINDNSVGIKQDCKPALKVISKCARYAETGLKIMSQIPDNENSETVIVQKDDLEKLFIVFAAQCTFLRSEYASLVVRLIFNEEGFFLLLN